MTAIRLLTVFAAFFLGGCYQFTPHRIAKIDDGIYCTPEEQKWFAECKRSLHERTKDYDLFYVEFTDQGWRQPEEPKDVYGISAEQLDYVTGQLRMLSTQSNADYEGISVVLFAHGWKHNAEWEDERASTFRELLGGVANVERGRAKAAKRKPRRVVGIYLAWRGRSLVFGEPFLSLTFWERKTAALEVSSGSARELFARLKVLRDSAPRLHEDYAVRFLIVGHSFGGLIVHSALSGPLIAELIAIQEIEQRRDAPPPRQGDMVILANPAFEGSRFEALYRVAERTVLPYYQPPLYVSVTSTADIATRYAFPIGRWFNTLFEDHESARVREASRNTPGHIERYVTHRLMTIEQLRREQAKGSYKEIVIPENPCLDTKWDVNLAVEATNARRELQRLGGSEVEPVLKPGWARFFCGGTVLIHKAVSDDTGKPANAHSLVWNVQTDESVIRDHSDITEKHFVAFVRQIYSDAALVKRRYLPQEPQKAIKAERERATVSRSE